MLNGLPVSHLPSVTVDMTANLANLDKELFLCDFDQQVRVFDFYLHKVVSEFTNFNISQHAKLSSWLLLRPNHITRTLGRLESGVLLLLRSNHVTRTLGRLESGA